MAALPRMKANGHVCFEELQPLGISETKIDLSLVMYYVSENVINGACDIHFYM